MVKPVVFQVVGYQNSGKTTVMIKLIQALKDLGLTTVTIKHHGHGGKPEVIEQKDSTRHLSAGASASVVEGDGRLILHAENIHSSLEDQIRLMEYFQPDVQLIEGYKFENYPKLLLVRDHKDLSLLARVDNIKVIMYWEETLREPLNEQTKIPCFPIHDQTAILWTARTIKKLFLSKT
ncbi:molybdopterin-guanine dinucleotide biosynthesis protein B [Neobacillus vireti LMG 21834]|uniref:Molybdopterin-guanine dinucleotide biosynthesis protein B n=1 Tax=Neobacillus vireti LMG 21834 TaxID=1131730 RepID=A0AB94ING1_9BACI|nr:molybdopterin-guanine dinucleotide biosynthesis protein B [Neobacillus vireti LMG 21834]KLT19970.1 molybdopterin-guanine dinucleotide biosynthesis protein MobB [Neobacillus vireti]